MRKLAIAVVALGTFGAVPPALAGSTGVPASAGISGVVRNTTCAGPCRIPPPPPPRYAGDGLTVRVRSLDTHEIVGEHHPKDGRFHFDVGPGLYRVHAFIAEPSNQPRCWQGSRREVGIVDRGVRVGLTVHNDCIV